MDILIYTGVVLTLTQVLKSALGITSKFVPLVALLIGALFYIVAIFTGATTFDYTSMMNAIIGIFSAMGLYSGVKSTIK